MLTRRQKMVLKAIVDEFTKTAEPIGSKSLMLLLEEKYSSATLRNEMAILEELELLEKTHTSSGRMPSNKGYRYYVENLMVRELDENIITMLNEIFYSRQLSNEEIMQESCRILSEMTSLTSIILGSDAKYARLAHIQVIPIDSKNAIAVFVADDGHTEHKKFVFDDTIALDDIQNCCKVLNEHLKGTLLTELKEKLEALKPLLKHTSNRYEILFQAMMSAFIKFHQNDTMYTSGQTKMLYQPEFDDAVKMRKFMELMENSNVWRELSNYNESLNIQIGTMSHQLDLKDISVISSSFAMNSEEKGKLMIVGPTRMPYNKVISLLEYVAKQLELLYSGGKG